MSELYSAFLDAFEEIAEHYHHDGLKKAVKAKKMAILQRENFAKFITSLFGSKDKEKLDRIRRDDEYYHRTKKGMAAIFNEVLSPREKKVLLMNYGLEDGTARSLEEIAQAFGVEQEIIRQIVAKGLRKLRHPSVSSKIKAFL